VGKLLLASGNSTGMRAELRLTKMESKAGLDSIVTLSLLMRERLAGRAHRVAARKVRDVKERKLKL
jgi:hypothetical protein